MSMAQSVAPLALALPLQILLSVAMVTALGPLLYREFHEPATRGGNAMTTVPTASFTRGPARL